MSDALQKPAVPTLRFPEFKGDWKPSYAGDAFRNSRTKGEAGLPIYSVTMDRGLVPRDTLDRHLASDAEDGVNLRAQKGDLVYNMMRMWQGAVGLADKECMVSPAYVVLAPKKGTSPEFFNFWFQSARMLYLLWAYSHGLTNDRLRLYFDDFAKIPIHLPTSNEQKKIAAFLSTVDAKLEALRRKRLALIRYKTGLMKKLFSKSLRFSQHDGTAFPDWQDKKISDVIRLKYGKDQKNLGEGEIPVFGSGGIIRYADDYLYDGPSVLIGRKGTINKPMYINGPFWAVDTMFYTEIIEEHHPYFVYCLMQFVELEKYAETTGVPSLSAGVINSLSVSVPSAKSEQAKIAEAVLGFDSKIEAVSKTIRSIDSFKKSLLQKLFV